MTEAERLVLFLDFDGTLRAISARPFTVRLAKRVRELLARMARDPRIVIYILSGRDLADLKRRASVPGVHLLGLHGWQGRPTTDMSDEKRLLQRAKHKFENTVARLPGIWIQDKRLGLGVHYRGAPTSSVAQAWPVVKEVTKGLGPKVHVLHGKKIWEILPSVIKGKGPAVRAVLKDLPEPALPIFVGDDITDESAFKALPRGITIHVGHQRHTTAKYQLNDPNDVHAFLRKLDRLLASRPA
jgi:trehalose-phosphatase